MNRRYKAEYLARLTARLALGTVLYAHARTRRQVREVKARWLP